MQLEQLQLFPTMRLVGANETLSSVAAEYNLSGARKSGVLNQMMSHRGNRFRWLWHGGSFSSHCSKAIPWEERVVKTGDGIRWSSSHPHVLKVDHEGVHKLTVAVFHNGRDHAVPTITVYINGDAVLNGVSSHSSCILRPATGGAAPSSSRQSGASPAPQHQKLNCACEPQLLNGLSVSDMFYFPLGAVITVAYRADPRNVMQAVLDVETLS